jgi:predicted transcriptional regulator
MYGVKRTTIYLPEDMKSRLEREAARRQITEAELIRRAVDNELHRRAPRGGIISGGPEDGITGANLHEHMEGFGEL